MYFHYHRSCDPDVHLWVKFSQGFKNLIFFGFYKIDQIPVFGETENRRRGIYNCFRSFLSCQLPSIAACDQNNICSCRPELTSRFLAEGKTTATLQEPWQTPSGVLQSSPFKGGAGLWLAPRLAPATLCSS